MVIRARTLQRLAFERLTMSDSDAFGWSLPPEEIAQDLRSPNMEGILARWERERRARRASVHPDRPAVGLLLYQARPRALRLCVLVVHPAFRRLGVGTAMVEKVVDRLRQHPMARRAEAILPERDLPMQRLLRAAGWRCERTLPRWFAGDDGYLFCLRRA